MKRRLLFLVGVIWAAPCSALGLAVALPVLLMGGSVRWVGLALECSPFEGTLAADSRLRRVPFSAITFGHVILGVSTADLDRLRRHEQAHVRQYERWGPLLVIAYPLASILAVIQGRSPYHQNRFELQACREARASQTE